MVQTEWGDFADELTPAEALMWKTDDHVRLRTGGAVLLMLDRAPEWGRLVETFERVSRLFPRLRQRIIAAPFDVTRPRWVTDVHFDLSFHLRRLVVSGPDPMRELLRLVELNVGESFDRARPLWAATLVELPAGAAMILKLSHVMTDGKGSIQLLERFCGQDPNPTHETQPVAPAPETLGEIDLLRAGLDPRRALSAGLVRLTGAARLLRRPVRTVRTGVEMASALRDLARPDLAAPSPLFRGRSTSCRVGVFDVPFRELKAAGNAVGGSLNDALLAAVAGGMRLYHERLDAPVPSVNIVFPVSLRTEEDPMAGNRFSGVTIAAPLEIVDPAERVRLLHEASRTARDAAPRDVVGPLTTVLHRLPAWILATIPIMQGIDAQVSNIPGMMAPHYLAGSEVTGVYGFGPHPGTPMMIALVSHVTKCCISVNADAAAVPSMDLLIACLEEGFDEVLRLAPELAHSEP